MKESYDKRLNILFYFILLDKRKRKSGEGEKR